MKRASLRILSILVLASLCCLMLSACGNADPALQVNGDGSYRFTAQGSDSYILQLFAESEYTGEELVEGAEYALTKSIPAGSGEQTGKFDEMDTIPFGDYLAVLYSMDSNFEKSLIDTCPISYGGQLSTPIMSYQTNGYQIIVTLIEDSFSRYNSLEKVTDCTVEVYTDPDCTGTPLTTVTMPASEMRVEVDETSSMASTTYFGNTAELLLDGTLGQEATFYLRAKMAASSDGLATESAYSEIFVYSTNGTYASRTGVTVPADAQPNTKAATYEVTGFQYQVEQSTGSGPAPDGAGSSQTQDYNIDCLVSLNADGTYAIYTRNNGEGEYTLSDQGTASVLQDVMVFFTAEDGSVSAGYFTNDGAELVMVPGTDAPAATLTAGGEAPNGGEPNQDPQPPEGNDPPAGGEDVPNPTDGSGEEGGSGDAPAEGGGGSGDAPPAGGEG